MVTAKQAQVCLVPTVHIQSINFTCSFLLDIFCEKGLLELQSTSHTYGKTDYYLVDILRVYEKDT